MVEINRTERVFQNFNKLATNIFRFSFSNQFKTFLRMLVLNCLWSPLSTVVFILSHASVICGEWGLSFSCCDKNLLNYFFLLAVVLLLSCFYLQYLVCVCDDFYYVRRWNFSIWGRVFPIVYFRKNFLCILNLCVLI